MEELNNKPLYKLSRKSFRNMVLWMQENGLSSARINRLLSTCRNLLNFGLDDDDYSDEFEDCKANPSRIKGMQKEKRREIVFLTDEEVLKIHQYLIDNKEYSQALLCALMYDSACRRNEAYQVKKGDISLDSNFTKTEVIGKRGKKFKLMYHDLTKESYKLLIEHNDLDDNDSLWLTKSGTSASYESLYAWVSNWRKILNNEKEFNPHSFRHSALENYSTGEHYVARNLGKKFELQELKLLAHHEDLSTTDSYLRKKEDELLLEAFNL